MSLVSCFKKTNSPFSSGELGELAESKQRVLSGRSPAEEDDLFVCRVGSESWPSE